MVLQTADMPQVLDVASLLCSVQMLPVVRHCKEGVEQAIDTDRYKSSLCAAVPECTVQHAHLYQVDMQTCWETSPQAMF